MDPLLAESLPPGKPIPSEGVVPHWVYVAIPFVLFAFDLLVGATSQAGGCAAFGEAINLVMANMVITFLTWMTCGIEMLRGRRSALLSLGLVLNFAWILPLLLFFGPRGS